MSAPTKAIVLRSVRYGEDKNIVSMLTSDYGKLSFMVYGAHSKRASVRASLLAPLAELDIECDYRRSRRLQRMTEAEPSVPILPYDSPSKGAFAFFAAEMIDRCVPAEQPDAEVFAYAASCACRLRMPLALDRLSVTRFLLSFSRRLGFYPSADDEFIASFPDANSRKSLRSLMSGTEPRASETSGITKLLIEYYRHNLPGLGEIASLELAEALL